MSRHLVKMPVPSDVRVGDILGGTDKGTLRKREPNDIVCGVAMTDCENGHATVAFVDGFPFYPDGVVIILSEEEIMACGLH